MKKKNVLFICIHNSARSQMAEAFLNQMAGHRFYAQSAGLEPGSLNPLAVEAMHEIGIDISHHKTKSVSSLIEKEVTFDYVVTVCDEGNTQRCPQFPGFSQKIHWAFEDPAGFQGTWEEKLKKTKEVRDKIKKRIEEWVIMI